MGRGEVGPNECRRAIGLLLCAGWCVRWWRLFGGRVVSGRLCRDTVGFRVSSSSRRVLGSPNQKVQKPEHNQASGPTGRRVVFLFAN